MIVNEPPTPDCVFTNLEISFQGRQRNGKVLTTSNLQAERRRQRILNILNHLAGTNEHAGHFPLEKAPHFDRALQCVVDIFQSKMRTEKQQIHQAWNWIGIFDGVIPGKFTRVCGPDL